MKTIIFFVENHSINWPLIWHDCSPYIVIWLFLFMFFVIWAAKNYERTVKKEAEESINQQIYALSHELDQLESEKNSLFQAFLSYKNDVETEISGLKKQVRKRDEKGHFLPTSGNGHGKKKNLP